MPKVQLIKQNPLDETARKVIGYFDSNLSPKNICRIMGYTMPTHYDRKKDPEKMTLRELRILCEETGLPDSVIMKMIRKEPVT